jgi:hypothetical protein
VCDSGLDDPDWDGAKLDENEDDGKALTNWKFGCAIANTFYEFLQ